MIFSGDSSSNGHTPRSWRNVTPAHPCPVCRKPDQCSVSEDGDYAVCFRVGDAAHGKTAEDGRTYYVHRLTPAPQPSEPRYSLEDGGGRLADPDIRDEIYSALLACLKLSEQHHKDLRARGLKDGLEKAGYRSLPERGRYRAVRRLIEAGFEHQLPTVPGFIVAQREDSRYWTVAGMAGLLIPIRDASRRIVALKVRPDDQTGGKYRYLTSRCPTKGRHGPSPGTPIHVPLFDGETTFVRVTEGALKADIATRLSGVLTIGLPGVGMWSRAPAVLHEFGAETVRIALDSDASRNRAVGEVLHQLARRLVDDGGFAAVELETWDQQHKGIDDLLLASQEANVVRGEEVLLATQAIAESAAASGSSAPASAAPNAGFVATGAVLIYQHFVERYRPTFRRGAVIYSEALGREVRASEACYAASTELLALLESAVDCPKSEKGTKRELLPRFFTTWAPVAWRDLLDQLQEEEQSAEVVGSAAEEFRRKVAAGLHTHVALGNYRQDAGETVVERRTLLNWASLFAKPGAWKQVRTYLLWCRLDGNDPSPPMPAKCCDTREREAQLAARESLMAARLRVAIRVGLFTSGQAHLRRPRRDESVPILVALSVVRRRLTEGWRRRARTPPAASPLSSLPPEFVAELLSGPGQAEAKEQGQKREPGEEG